MMPAKLRVESAQEFTRHQLPVAERTHSFLPAGTAFPPRATELTGFGAFLADPRRGIP